MSGGAMDYLYEKIEEFVEYFEDPEIIDLAKDFADLAHDCEWYHSSDTSMGEYKESLLRFKKKWFCTPDERIERLRTYIVSYADKILGTGPVCNKCKHFTAGEDTYGSCDLNPHCLVHAYDECGKFEAKE